MKRRLFLFISMGIVVIFSACQKGPNAAEINQGKGDNHAVEVDAEQVEPMEVIIRDKEGLEIGKATLSENESGVKVHVQADHLKPGEYGIHLHENAICEGPNFDSAEGHFNPDDKNHGFYHPSGPHKGDMENLKVNEDGIADQVYVNQLVTLKENDANSLTTEGGTSIIIHEKQDDYVSQPSGDAGKRIYCGEIKK